MFGDDENLGHQTSPFCLSAATSSATSFTMTPFWRDGGRLVLQRLELRAGVDAEIGDRRCVSSGFFFAFMMSGSFT